ncbi:antigen 5 like allergen Cul n 1-like [Anopheles marshallii]|uniref:antigen 5 like allergen Cul n 1-like n=1 Tax=Anopheles marshallii TaxID=1521116 RepID=UPI00237B3987|nr:antigen 5 like allergen Cul n 1-like [Anopheles marshallii]
MASWIFVAIVCCLVSGLQTQTNYCTTTYCKTGVPNVGCNPPPATGGISCAGKSPAVVVMDSNLQSLILSEHNTRRSKFALGQLAPCASCPSFLPAKAMPTITWDTELANQAGNNARSCVYGHDRCRNTPVYAWAGQNIAMSQFYGMTKTTSQLVLEGINGWWSEYNVTTQTQLDGYPSGYTGPAIGHFTQMVSDQTDKMGCAMQYWLDGQWKTYYFVCNYAVTNVVSRPVYKNGTFACTTGRNPISTMNGLCSTAEKIVPVYN